MNDVVVTVPKLIDTAEADRIRCLARSAEAEEKKLGQQMRDLALTIYVWPHKITRNGKRIDGWQAGFWPKGGGVTHEDKDEAIKYQRDFAQREGVIVVDIVELS